MAKTGIFSVFLFAAAGAALLADFRPPAATNFFVRFGFVRADQLVANMTYADLVNSPDYLQRRLALDAANPYRWAELGEYFTAEDKTPEAARAFERATELGPNIPPVLMRAANFYVLQEQRDRVRDLGSRVLRLTPEFDDILFTDYARLGIADGIPAEARPARAWMLWVLSQPGDPQAAWRWLNSHKLADDTTAIAYVRALWKRQNYEEATGIWAAWTDPDRHQLLLNHAFKAAPRPVPCDWIFGNAVAFEFRDGLHIRFTGNDGGGIAVLSQDVAVAPGRYHFAADVSASNITTDQGPFFHMTGRGVDVMTPAISGTMPRRTVEVSFTVPAGTRLIRVGLERNASSRFDNKIKGDLQIHEVSLARL